MEKKHKSLNTKVTKNKKKNKNKNKIQKIKK